MRKLIPVDRDIPVKNSSAVVHGVFGLGAMQGKRHIETLPSLAKMNTFSNQFDKWLKIVNNATREWEEKGYFLLPREVSISKDNNFLLFVRNDSPMGKHVAKLTPEQRSALYENGSSICQYGNQPFSPLLTDCPVKVIDEGYMEVPNGIKVPFNDGGGYAGPNSEIRRLLPDVVNNLGMKRANMLKVIGYLKDQPFVFVKAVVSLLDNNEEWRRIADVAGVPVDYPGIVTNLHGIKNKVGIPLDLNTELTFNIGYHSDNRLYENKRAFYTFQAYRRTPNLSDKMRYSKAVVKFMEDAAKAIQAGDQRAFVSMLDSYRPKDTPFQGDMIGSMALGLPAGLIRNFPTEIKNYLRKRAGRRKIPFSMRTMPKCSHKFGMIECGLTPSQAYDMRVGVGRRIVMIRSPKAGGYPAIVLKVTSTKEPAFSINPVLYALWYQGDFDGDTVALMPNAGIPESNLEFADVTKLLHAKENPKTVEWVEKRFNEAFIDTYQFEGIHDLHPACGYLYQMVRAKVATGAYDNFATRFALTKQGASDSNQRTFWRIPQKAITNMKHVGDPIAAPYELGCAIQASGNIHLPKLDVVHYLLAGKKKQFIDAKEDKQIPSEDDNPLGVRLFNSFESIDGNDLVEKTVDYTNSFIRETKKYMNAELIPHVRSVIKDEKFLYGPYNIMVLKPPFGYLLNPPTNRYPNLVEFSIGEMTWTKRFQLLIKAVDSEAKEGMDPIKLWQFIYCIAITEKLKRWLLTNRTNVKEIDDSIGAMIAKIAVKCGYEKVEIDEDSNGEELDN